MHSSAARANSIPASEKRASTRLWNTTAASPASATSSPSRRSGKKRRSSSSRVRIGWTPSSVAITPGVTLWAMAWK